MTTITLRSLGGSVVLAVPKQMLGMMHLGAGSQVEVNVENGKLVVEPRRKPHYTLCELLAQCNEDNMAPTSEDLTWLEAPPVGKEVS
jgi:antitoxin ChpS